MKRCLVILSVIVITVACKGELSDKDMKGMKTSVEAVILEVINQEGSTYSWQDEDRIGVSVKDMVDYHSETNIAFEYDKESGCFSPVQTDLILKGAERILYAYFPFVGPELERPAKKEFSTVDQTYAGQKEYDWLFAQTTATREDPVARFEFSHVMGKVYFEFEHEKLSSGQVSGFTVSGICHNGRFDPYTGELVRRNDVTEDCLPVVDGMSSGLVLIPQTAEITVSFIYNGESYRKEKACRLEVVANECRKYTISFGSDNLDKSLSIIPSGTVDWETGQVEDVVSTPIQVSVYDAGSTGTKAYTDEGFRTHFEKDDKVGLFAVKTDGTISERFDNLPLTYNGMEWKAETLLEYDSSLNGAVFHAYFPYSEDVLFDPLAEEPFSQALEASYTTDQSTAEKYRDCDMLTCSSQLYIEDGKQKLSLGMLHRRSLLSIELPRRACKVEGMSDYVISSWDVSFKDSDVVLAPLSVNGERQVYRLLVKSGDPVNVNCSFTYIGGSKTVSVTDADGMASGVCRQIRVDGGYEKVEQPLSLKVGDYYCSDGTIASYVEGVPAPDNAIGVIYKLGTTEYIVKDHPSCSHALVYALERTLRPSVAGDPGKYNLFEGDDYVSVFGLKQDKNYDYASIGLSTGDHNAKDLNGYVYTKSWLQYVGTLGHTALFKASIGLHNEQNPLPAGLTTGWYLPSYDEYVLMASGQEILDASLANASAEKVFEGTAAGADAKTFRGYWTSSMRATGAVVNYYSLGSNTKETGYVDGRYGFFRYAFGF